MTKVLLVEDDKEIIQNLSSFLKEEGFGVTAVTRQDEVLAKLESEQIDLVLLDVTLEQGNGYSTCRQIKAEYDLPIIFLTAMGDEFSVIAGLDMGADDYVSKPFRPRELVSRMKTVLRRSGKTKSMVKIGSLEVDTVRGTIRKDGAEVYLSALEYRLLLVFLNHRGILLSREQLLDEIWDMSGEFVNDNTLTVYIRRLREKIEDNPAKPELILTVRGMGYRMN